MSEVFSFISVLLTKFPLSHITLPLYLLIPQPCLFLLYFSLFFFEHQTGLVCHSSWQLVEDLLISE